LLPVTRWFIKAGMIYLTSGMLLLFIDSMPLIGLEIQLLPVYWHMIVIGWITQIIMGVSIWMFPRKRRDRQKRESVLTWSVFGLLNTGLILRFISEPFSGNETGFSAAQWIILLSIFLQLAAAVLYVAEIWPRVQPKRKRKSKT